MHIYDYIIIGSGITGLTIAKQIYSETTNILVLEQQEEFGGNNKPVYLNGQILNNGMRFYPHTESSVKAAEFMSTLLNRPSILATEALENHIETYEASGFKKFLGFGDQPPEFYEQLSYFLATHEAELTLPPYAWIQQLAQDLAPVLQRKSIVTRLGFEGLDTEKPVLTHVIVNGSKTLYSRNFIYAGQIKELSLLVPDDVMNARTKAKLKKSVAWQSVGLDLYHETPMTKRNMFLLNGTTDDEIGPCIGRFVTDNISQWTSFIDSESAEDTENIGLVLKKMKRQIRRAFPELADSIKKERISVSTPLSGADLKLNANGTLPKVDNLWIASSEASRYQNLLGAIMQARLVLSSLGFISSTDTEAVDMSRADAAAADHQA